MVYYFAYGSNMDLDQMDERCPGNYKLLGVGMLEKREFFVSLRKKGGTANIRRKKNLKVYGLLFEINKKRKPTSGVC